MLHQWWDIVFGHMMLGLLQMSRYITQQMQAEVVIDINKFLGAFSIKIDKGHLHPPSWTQCEDDEHSANILSHSMD